MRDLRQLTTVSLLKTEQWDRYKHLRGVLALAMVICVVAAPIDWYNWLEGSVSLAYPICLTAGAVAILVAVPRKGNLITLTLAGVFVLSIIGTLIRRAPLGVGLALIGSSAVGLFLWTYVRQRIGGQRNVDGTQVPR